MTNTNLFSGQHHGFRSGRSCATQLLEAVQDRIRAMASGNTVDIIYLDFSKALTKSHTTYYCTNGQMLIRGRILKWITSFLVGETQRVVLNGSQFVFSFIQVHYSRVFATCHLVVNYVDSILSNICKIKSFFFFQEFLNLQYKWNLNLIKHSRKSRKYLIMIYAANQHTRSSWKNDTSRKLYCSG